MSAAATLDLVRTVLGDIPTTELGRVDAHEHVFLRSPILAGDEFTDPVKMTAELDDVRRSGIDTVVDLTTIGIGRRPSELREVSQRSGVKIVAATGFHRDAHYRPEHWCNTAPHDVLVDTLCSDISVGIDERDWGGPHPKPSDCRAGIIKLGASYHGLSPKERRRLEAGAEAARTTGVPIAVHTEIGTAAHEILDALDDAGIDAARVVLAHMDRNADAGLHASLTLRGARLVYDTVGRIKYRPDSDLLELITTMTEHGHADRILLGTDVGRRQTLRAYGGGPGMAVLGREFVPRLAEQLGDDLVHQLLVQNPADFLRLRESDR